MTRGSPTPCGCPNYVQFIVGKELGLQVVAKSTQETTAEIRGLGIFCLEGLALDLQGSGHDPG